MKLWIDVNDLFVYARHHVRPSGIQRLSGELYEALFDIAPDRIGFVVHGAEAGTFQIVQWAEVERVYRQLTNGQEQIVRVPEVSEHRSFLSALREIGTLLFRRTSTLQIGWRADRHSNPAFDSCNRDDASSAQRPPGSANEHSQPADLRAFVQPGDFLCSLGAPWWHDPSYAKHFSELKQHYRMQLALLVYDLIPLLCPEFYDGSRAPNFAKVMRETLSLADVLLTISHHTAGDVVKWAAAEGITLGNRPLPIPVGSGFKTPVQGRLPAGLEPGNFVLFVSTIEVRKNHFQAFRVWRRMLDDMPPQSVPPLVFVGNVGWMVGDLLQAIKNTDQLGGKLLLLHEVDDATLSALYRECQFTIYPSHYEGWGLPVSDSLAFGKLCIASNRTSVPEAGGNLCLYIDPDNTTGAYDVIRGVIENPRERLKMEEQIRNQFHPVPWTTTARAVLQALDEHRLGENPSKSETAG